MHSSHTVPCVSAVLGPISPEGAPSLIPEFTDQRYELGHKMASRLQTQALRRASFRTRQEADIATKSALRHKATLRVLTYVGFWNSCDRRGFNELKRTQGNSP